MDDPLSSHITLISLLSAARKGMIYIGLALLLIGGIGYAVNAIIDFAESINPYYQYACHGLAGVGLLLIILGFILKETFYRFFGAGITEEIARPCGELTGAALRIRGNSLKPSANQYSGF